jgi:hypothetical protein
MRNTNFGSTGTGTAKTENQSSGTSATKNHTGETVTKLNRLIPSHLQIAPTIKLTLSVPS